MNWINLLLPTNKYIKICHFFKMPHLQKELCCEAEKLSTLKIILNKSVTL